MTNNEYEHYKAEWKAAFQRAHDGHAQTPEQSCGVPEMIARDQPVPRPRPPALGAEVDEELFKELWQAEMAKVKQLPEFQPEVALRDEFNTEADRLAQIQARLEHAEDVLSEATEDYLRDFEGGLPFNPEKLEHIVQLNRDVRVLEDEVQDLQSYQVLDQAPYESDQFERASGRSNRSGSGLGE